MEIATWSSVRRVIVGRRPPWPKSKKAWAVITLSMVVMVFLAAGFAQIFRAGQGNNPGEQGQAPVLEWRDMIDVVTRYGRRPVDSGETPDLDMLLATPQYFGALRRTPPVSATTEPSLLFYATENVHIDRLPDTPPAPTLRIGALRRLPSESVVLAESEHHRSTLLRYTLSSLGSEGILEDGDVIELSFDGTGAGVMTWSLPLKYSDSYSSSEVAHGLATSTFTMPAMSGVAVLAVMGGLLAAMWPCLFQLTAYFIPAMAGMSMQDASSAQGVKPRIGVVKIAIFFVLGFTIIYTLAGALIGYGSQQLSNMESFFYWQRYISIGAGVILLGLALRVAARVRAPLVCKMPIVSKMASNGVTSPWESMVVGVTFATGCMTCFGSAVLIGMVVYVGLAGSPLVGAALLFLFSLGMGVPLIIGALAMAKILPLLFKMEKAMPWMGLASATVIAGYAVLLISGNFMAVSGRFYRLLGLAPTFG